MGRRSSDSEDDSRSRRKRKQRRRSSSSSSSSSSSGSRVTSRSRRSSRRSRSRSRDKDRDRRRKRRSSSSSSHSSSRKRRSRSAAREKGRNHRSHRSRSRDKRSHSRHRRSRSKSGSRSRRGSHSRKRSRSRERDRSRRKGRNRERDKEKERDKGRDKDKSKDKADRKREAANIKGRLEHLTPAEQAKVRMHMVLQAAAKTDEVLKAKVAKREEEARKKLEEEGTTLEEQVRRIKDIEAIESDSFVPQAFKSSRDDIKTEPAEVKQEERADSQDITLPLSIVYDDTDTLAHPNLFMDKEKAEELWLNRLVSLRQERLMGTSKSVEMFNSNFRDFDEDPFFSDPFRAHREHMRQMMRSFSEPFGGPSMPSIMDGRGRGHDMAEHPGSSVALRDEHRDMMRNPFGMFDNVMANMRNRMQDMNRNFENMSTDSNTHSFSSSSVMTYSKVGNEPPKVFQASSSTRRAPGGIKEIRRAVKDSDSGLEKMSIGHHIEDRGHVVEKKFNKKTGEKEFNQDFQNLDEYHQSTTRMLLIVIPDPLPAAEAQTFDDEWQQELSKFKPSGPLSRLEEARPRAVRREALAGPEPAHRDQSKGKAEGKSNMKGSDSTRP
ncbi:putative myeloid leukemia factor 1 [Scophthalmus maximus]|uniref:Putative myeloid leukemia factor 1 n=1 Tax=Scophthalmus maximus TaxID=52904 RepID=A0A2U9B5I9_SCOMX|nr:putative myeloid leukemia factor 1 [Scophthalmus maximus]